MKIAVARWAAWAPGLDDAAAWERWSRTPTPLRGTGAPDVRFLAPLVRRRCGVLTRLMLHVAHACGASEHPDAPTVFASRHGDCAGALALMNDLADGTALTAGAFSHSVHNTAAGLHSIIEHNTGPSTATAGTSETFGSGMIEAVALLRRTRAARVLLVVGDAPLPGVLSPFTSEPSVPYALAVLLAGDGDDGQPIEVAFGAEEGQGSPWPDAVEFLRWLLSSEPTATIGRGRNRMRWSRRV